jgi:hypothetical protein
MDEPISISPFPDKKQYVKTRFSGFLNMCFSEKASFAASSALTLISLVCFWTVKNKKDFYALAAIPFLFALQQAAEGVQWLAFQGMWGTLKEAKAATDLYVLIAYVIWPFWMPFSLWVAEKQDPCKRYLELLLLVGICVALYNAWKLLMFPSHAKVVENSIQYIVDVHEGVWLPYASAVILPWFCSSLSRTSILGSIFATATAISAFFYYETFISVWCFFAALVSLSILWMLRNRNIRV